MDRIQIRNLNGIVTHKFPTLNEALSFASENSKGKMTQRIYFSLDTGEKGSVIFDYYGSVFWKDESGKHHREDGPAIIHSNGDKLWVRHGEWHREDGPSYELSNSSKGWQQKSEFHRENGPAMECKNGDKRWYVHGKLHRVDGPAIEFANGRVEYWLNGERMRMELCLPIYPE